MSKKLKHRKVYVQSFPGAMTKCMEDYKKYLMRDKPDHLILQFGTNDLTGSYLEFEYDFDFFANALFWESGDNLDFQRPTVAKVL